MLAEINRGPNDPPIVEPRKFLVEPFDRVKVGELVKPPGVKLLKWLPTVPAEIGLVYQEPRWFVIKASPVGVPSWVMPENSDLLLHSHSRSHESYDPGYTAIPSINDFINCSSIARNFVISEKGLTQFWPIQGEPRRTLSQLNLHLFMDRFHDGLEFQLSKYLEFLKSIKEEFVVLSWKGLSDQKLEKLFHGNVKTQL